MAHHLAWSSKDLFFFSFSLLTMANKVWGYIKFVLNLILSVLSKKSFIYEARRVVEGITKYHYLIAKHTTYYLLFNCFYLFLFNLTRHRELIVNYVCILPQMKWVSITNFVHLVKSYKISNTYISNVTIFKT